MKLVFRSRRWLVVGLSLVLIFTVVGFLVLPPIIKSQLEQRLSAQLGRRTTVEKVKFNPYTLALTLENFAIAEKDAAAPKFLGWRSLYVNFDALSSLRGEWVLSEIALDGFSARVAINPDQSFNFSDVLARLAPPADAAKPKSPAPPARPVRIASLKVSDARVDFADASRVKPFATVVGPLTFALTEFRTVSERGAPYRFAATTEAGEKLAWSGTLQADPARSAGEFALQDIVLPKYAPYYADRIGGDLLAGTLSVRGWYEVDLAGDKRTLKLSDGAVQLRGLKLAERASTEPAVELPTLDIAGIAADGVATKATIRSVALAGGHLRVRREKNGAINLLALLQPPAAKDAATTPAPAVPAVVSAPAAQPDVRVGEVTLKDFQVDVTDLAAPRPVQLALGALNVSLKDLTLANGAQMPLQVGFSLASGGTVSVDGTVGLSPVRADLKTAVTALQLLPFSPYLEQALDARLTEGALTTALAAQVALPEGKPLDATVSGDVTLEKLGLVDAAQNEELAGFASLGLRGLKASTTPELVVSLDEIALTGSYARAIVNRDQSLNLAKVFRLPAPAGETPASSAASATAPVATVPAPTTPPASAPATANGAASPKITIGKIVLAGGDYRFTDRSLEPNVGVALREFGGTIAGLSSTNPAKADVELSGSVDGAGPVSIRGKLDPLGAATFVDLKVDFKNVDLVPLSPYSGKFAGYELARGKLMLDVKLLLEGKKIDATNVLTLNQFTFGAPVSSPDATKLPVRLGVALLKDIDGNIVIDLPVQGSMDDPNFRIGRVVLRVIVNLLTKAAVSPFSLLGAAFGGGGDELAFQDFAPGSAELRPAEVKKLETMTQALTNRPGLSLGLEGSYDTAADAYALKRVKLADQVRRAIWEAKHATDPNIPPPAQLAIAPEEEAAMIKRLFDAQFPPGTQFGTPVPPPPAAVAPPPPPPAGFFKRVVRVLTFRERREVHAAQAENTRLAAEHTKAVAAATAAGLPLEEMSGRLAEAIAIDKNDLRALAQARAEKVRAYFSTTGKIAAERLFLAKDQTDAAKQARGPRVFLGLQ